MSVLITVMGARNVLSNEDGTAVIPAAPGLDSFIRENLPSFGGKIDTALEWDCNGEDITMVYRCAGVAIEEVHHIVVNLLATYNSQ